MKSHLNRHHLAGKHPCISSAAFSMCTVYDVYGNVITPLNGQLPVSTEPVFVECP